MLQAYRRMATKELSSLPHPTAVAAGVGLSGAGLAVGLEEPRHLSDGEPAARGKEQPELAGDAPTGRN